MGKRHDPGPWFCDYCGNEYERNQGRGGELQRFCCMTCTELHNRAVKHARRLRLSFDASFCPVYCRKCKQCGVGFVSRNGKQRFCAKSCSQRTRELKHAYGLSLEERDALVASQGGICAICGERGEGCGCQSGLFIDHDHVTGEVRAMLCRKCNSGIGMFRDDPGLLIAASEYVREHNKKRHLRAV